RGVDDLGVLGDGDLGGGSDRGDLAVGDEDRAAVDGVAIDGDDVSGCDRNIHGEQTSSSEGTAPSDVGQGRVPAAGSHPVDQRSVSRGESEVSSTPTSSMASRTIVQCVTCSDSAVSSPPSVAN